MPRKAGTGTKSDRQRIQFAYNADRDMPIGVVLRYLIDNPRFSSREGKHKGLDAIAAFWKPFAYQAFTDASEETLQALAREAIEALTHHMALIRNTFGVEIPQPEAGPQHAELKEMIQQAVTAAMLNLVESGAIAMPPASPQRASTASPLDGVEFDEDSLFGDLLENQAQVA